jgi:tRNA(Ile2) C34 agmatinyltransferase TiaS
MIELYGTLVHPDSRRERVKVVVDVATGKIGYSLITPDYEAACPNCNRTITFRGDGRFRCPYCHASKS